jgi:hypothetical protein
MERVDPAFAAELPAFSDLLAACIGSRATDGQGMEVISGVLHTVNTVIYAYSRREATGGLVFDPDAALAGMREVTAEHREFDEMNIPDAPMTEDDAEDHLDESRDEEE